MGDDTTSGNRTSARTRWILFLQLSVSAALLIWLFGYTDFRTNVSRVIASSHPSWLVTGFAVAGIAQFLCLVRWRIFLRVAGVAAGWRESAGVFFAGLFANLFLPGGAGGDLVKIGLLKGRGHEASRAALSVMMDRFCGSASMILVGMTLIIWRKDWLAQSPAIGAVMNGILIYLGGLALVILLTVVLSARGVTKRLPARAPGREKLIELSEAYFRFATDARRSLWALAVSTTMLVLYFLTYVLAARACGLATPVGDLLAIMPAVDILAGMPVSLGGVGVREGAFVILLGELAGVAPAVAISVSLTGYFLSVLWAVPGAVLWILKGRKT